MDTDRIPIEPKSTSRQEEESQRLVRTNKTLEDLILMLDSLTPFFVWRDMSSIIVATLHARGVVLFYVCIVTHETDFAKPVAYS